MEAGESPPPGGAEESQNPVENPRAPQQEGENPPTPQQQFQNPSTPSQTTLESWGLEDNSTSETTSLPPPPSFQTGIPHVNIQVDSPVVNPTYTSETTDVIMTTRPKTPPLRTTQEDETDLMQDIRLAVQTQGQPSKPKQQDSPTTRVSTGAWALPKLPGSEIEKPEIENPLKTPEVTQGSSKSPGTSDGSPHLVTPPAKASPPKKVNYPDTNKGTTNQNPPTHHTTNEIANDKDNIKHRQ